MKNITYKTITIFLLFIIFIILNTGESKAVLQANGNTSATYNLSDWMLNVRKMEQAGGAMGLSETLNSDLTSSGSSNNIDVHMQKNTEYGALAILSASSYGNPNVIGDGQTTTGNATGVVMKINTEWVAGGSATDASNYNRAKSRYKNMYTATYVAKRGDAIEETSNWHGSSSVWGEYGKNWSNSYVGVVRAYKGSIFSYYFYADANISFGDSTSISKYDRLHYSRAVVVSGQRTLKK